MNRNVLTFVFLIISFVSVAQKEYTWDSTRTKMRKNIIRWNATPMALFGPGTIILGYERVITPHQTFSFNAGSLQLAQRLNIDLSEYRIDSHKKNFGYSFALDYRFYLKKRNRGYAPDGLYFAPYQAYYRYEIEYGFTHVEPQSNTESKAVVGCKLSAVQLGLEIGYQYILFKRLAIDLVLLGPGYGTFSADFDVSGSLNLDENSVLYQRIYDRLAERIPGFDQLVQDQHVSESGSYNTFVPSLRYAIQIGFLF